MTALILIVILVVLITISRHLSHIAASCNAMAAEYLGWTKGGELNRNDSSNESSAREARSEISR